MLPNTISSLTARPGIAKIAAASGEPFASSAPTNRRTPPLSTGTLSTNLQRWLSIGSAVIRISAVLSGGGTVLPHGFRRGDHVFERGERLLPAARLETAVGVHPDPRVMLFSAPVISATGGTRGEWMSYTPGPISFGYLYCSKPCSSSEPERAFSIEITSASMRSITRSTSLNSL